MENRKAINSRKFRQTEKHKVWREANKERLKASNREYRLLNDYGITLEQYQEMLDNQLCSCAICKTIKTKEDRLLAVDHCHTTGKVRGLLCQKCNQAIGLLQDNPDIVDNAAIYLRK